MQNRNSFFPTMELEIEIIFIFEKTNNVVLDSTNLQFKRKAINYVL